MLLQRSQKVLFPMLRSNDDDDYVNLKYSFLLTFTVKWNETKEKKTLFCNQFWLLLSAWKLFLFFSRVSLLKGVCFYFMSFYIILCFFLLFYPSTVFLT